MAIAQKYPSVEYLIAASARRVPGFAHDYLTGSTGRETAMGHNKRALDNVQLMPEFVRSGFEPDTDRVLFGRTYAAPFGVAPLGMSGAIWPGSAEYLAAAAKKANVPFILSTVATTRLETIADIGGDNAWFQLYPPRDEKVNEDIIERARVAGYQVLVVTVDVPELARRERDIRNGLTVPPKFTLKTIGQVAMRPAWALATLRAGLPDFVNLTPYVPKGASLRGAAGYIASLARGHIGPERLKIIRDLWKGKLVVKGILSVADALASRDIGADGVIVSNHGGRQMDASPSPVDVLCAIKAAVGEDMAVMADSGVRSGLDIARMLALGADFVFAGRAFYHGVAALGAPGADHVMELFKAELVNNMAQLGCETVAGLPGVLCRDGAD